MAFLLNEDEEKQQNNQTISQTQGTQNQSGAQGQSINKLIKQPQGSGQFTNLQQFLQANQRSGQNIAEKVKSDVTTSTQNLATTGLQAITKAKSDLEQEKEKDKQSAGRLQSAAEQARQAITQNNPLNKPQEQVFNPFADLSKEDETDFYKITSGDVSNVQQGAQRFNTQVAQNLSDFGQQQRLLGESLADPNLRSQLMARSIKGGVGYTRGQEALDRSIVEAIGGSALKQGMYSGLGTIGQAGQEQEHISQDFGSLTKDYLQFLKEASEQSRGLLSGLSSDVQTTTQRRKEEVDQDLSSVEQFLKDLGEGHYSLQDLAKISAGKVPEGSRLFNVLKSTTLSDEERPLIKARKTDDDVIGEAARRVSRDRNKFSGNYIIPKYKLSNAEFDVYYDLITLPRAIEGALRGIDNARQRGDSTALASAQKDLNYWKNEFQSALKNASPKVLNAFDKEFLSVKRQVEQDWERDLRDRLADEQDVEYQEAITNKFLRNNFGFDLGSRLFGTNLQNLGQISREGLLDKVRTKEEAATLNAINRLLSGDKAEQLDLEKSLGLLAGQLATDMQQALPKSLQNLYENFMKDARNVNLFESGRHDVDAGWLGGKGGQTVDAWVNLADYLENPNSIQYSQTGRDVKRTNLGDAGSYHDAKNVAHANLMGAIHNALSARQYYDTLLERIKKNKKGRS
ncbi:MAG: hypothetical protein ABIM30_01095 [candidate division WOR-3 bacterium]